MVSGQNGEVTTDLHSRARAHGVATRYTGQDGSAVTVSDATLERILDELGEVTSSPLPGTITAYEQEEKDIPLVLASGEELTAEPCILLENGGRTTAVIANGVLTLPPLPAGWHELELSTTQHQQVATLLVSPRRLTTADPFLTTPATGVMAQLYSVRHKEAWGIGDYDTLATLGDSLHSLGGADFILVNPMHAAEATPPVEDSPYLPTSRRYTNPIYIAVESTPEYAAHPELHSRITSLAAPLKTRNATADLLERDSILSAKLTALHLLYSAGLSEERELALRDFRAREGEGLEAFTRWCADDHYDADFFAYIQMLTQEQEHSVQQHLTDHMRIGMIADLAVGVHPGGSDAQSLAEVLAPGASVGAPPDDYNQQGQDWSQPPLHPVKLAEAGYRPWRDMLRTILRTAGGIRIDHILGLFRLWWIPRGESPTEGTYVTYDHEAMVGALVLEAQRAGAVVIGEDLGTFEPWVQDYLAGRGILGTSVLWFEGIPPQDYRRLSLTSVTTHDLPPTASYLRGGHIDLRERLGLLTRDAAEERAEDAQWQRKVLSQVPKRNSTIEALHAFLAATPSALRCVALVDMVGDLRTQNQPGTTQEQYPNWRIPLCDGEGTPVTAESLASHPMAQAVLGAAR